MNRFGGKFDDLIFIREDELGTKSYLYLQAKHRLHEKPHPKAKSITTYNLFNDNKDDFRLVKYFHSYWDDIRKAEGAQQQCPRPDDKIHLVICTNIDFDLEYNGIEMTPLGRDQLDNTLLDDMLTFPKNVKWFKFLANVLYQCAKDNKPLDNHDNKIFANFLPTLLKEHVIDCTPIHREGNNSKNHQFHPDFIHDNFISFQTKRSDAKELRNILIALQLGGDGMWKNWEFRINSITSITDKEITISKIEPTLYRLKLIHWLAYMLRNFANNSKTALDEDGMFKPYLAALLTENVIGKTPVTTAGNIDQQYGFHADFKDKSPVNKRSNFTEELHKALNRLVTKGGCGWENWTFKIKDVSHFVNIQSFNGIANRKLDDLDTENNIGDFFDKLIFAVNTPNEDELEDILKHEMGVYLKLQDTDWQFSYIYTEMNKWFRNQENTWLSSDVGRGIFLDKIRGEVYQLAHFFNFRAKSFIV